MKKTLFLLVATAMSCNSSQKTVTDAATEEASSVASEISFAETITEAELKEHLYIYASDEFEGRETGQPGQKKAIAYLKAAYEKLGIPAAKKDGNYFQEVPLEISKLPIGKLTVDGTDFAVGEHVLTFSAANTSTDNIVYAAYGIEDDSYSNYNDLNVEGKIVLMKSGEPKNADGTFVISGTTETSNWSNMSESLTKRVQIAMDKGAIGVLYYDAGNFSRFKRRFESMKTNNSGRMEVVDNSAPEFYNLFIDQTLAKNILATIDTDDKPQILSKKVQLDFESSNDKISSENVVAILKGSEKPNEYLVISSHLDHIGITGDGDINNGADDDGSGTVALLEIAEAFKKAADAGNGPKRSIVFLHVTGEEKGLLGSQYYTDVDPIVPLANTVANLNIDMIGRIDPEREGDRNYIYLIGSDKLSLELHNLSEEVNKKFMNIELDYTYNDENDPNRFYYRSDHYNFAKNNIPIIFYFNGTHADYHKPSDTPDKINYDLLENRSRLIFYTAWEIANRENKLKVD
ncbi:Zn-dependent M28 family amino/carboxypeptidase [Maribacter spongiicola]|uniref:Zn-dependent M28 family amino/carboxypeptidase n=1 Tax=Maribacter spongiicola TaxID=1206753 RepID=A0A4R7K5X5_9FLAO|nr:M28 family peptidase [Maribacter spongiicola]TDT45079.1 Zn-dependent M28 family amino/carboxypeptidase [Maribacter spongiicola]